MPIYIVWKAEKWVGKQVNAKQSAPVINISPFTPRKSREISRDYLGLYDIILKLQYIDNSKEDDTIRLWERRGSANVFEWIIWHVTLFSGVSDAPRWNMTAMIGVSTSRQLACTVEICCCFCGQSMARRAHEPFLFTSFREIYLSV